MQKTTQNARKFESGWQRAAISSLILLGLIFSGLAVYNTLSSQPVQLNLEGTDLALVSLLSILLFFSSGLAWASLISTSSPSKGFLWVCLQQVGGMLLAKYIPGKVWGMVLKTMTAERMGVSASAVSQLAIVDLLLSLVVPMAMCLPVLLLLYPSELLPDRSLLQLALLVLTSLGFALLVGRKQVQALYQKAMATLGLESLTVSRLPLLRVALSALFVVVSWLCIYLVLAILIDQINLNDNTLWSKDNLMVFAAYQFSVIAGFVALFAPGGLLIREGAFIALVSPLLGFEQTAWLAVILRIWSTIFDIVFGSLALRLLISSK